MCSKLYTMMRVIITTSDAAPYAIGGTLLLRYKLHSRPSSYLYRHVISERGYGFVIILIQIGVAPAINKIAQWRSTASLWTSNDRINLVYLEFRIPGVGYIKYNYLTRHV